MQLTAVLKFLRSHMTIERVLWIALIVSLILYGKFREQHHKDQVENTHTYYNNYLDSTTQIYRDNQNRLVAKNKVLLGTKSELKQMKNVVEDLKEENVKLKNLHTHTEVTSNTTDTLFTTLRDTIVQGDTIKHFAYKDLYLSLRGRLLSDTLKIDYKYKQSLKITHHWEPQGFLKPKILTVKVRSENPNTTITGAKSVTISQPKHRFVVSAGIGYGVGMNDSKLFVTPIAGATIGYKIFSW